MTGEVQPVCARCEHTPLEHSAGPCHQRSAAGVGCDCGGWAAAVTLGRQALIQKIRDRVDLQAEAQRRMEVDEHADLLAEARREVDRLRAEVDALRDHAWPTKGEEAMAEALREIAGMHHVTVGGREVWHAEAECADLRGTPCHDFWPDKPEEWCSTCIAEVAWCAWKMRTLA